MQQDTIEVRQDERFDESCLADYLRGKLPGTDGPLTVRQFGGGSANLTYLLHFSDNEYVLRRPPLGEVAKSAHDMKREYTVLSVLHQAFPYAPHAYLYCDDLDILGTDFFIMERRQGIVIRRQMPESYTNVAHAPRRISLAMVDALADLHAVDTAAIGLNDLGKPAGFIERQVEGWYKRWQAAKTDDVAEIEAVGLTQIAFG